MTWSRAEVPRRLLPWVTYRQIDNWGRLGYWEAAHPPNGSGSRAVVTVEDLEGLAVLSRLAPFLLTPSHQRPVFPLPTWSELRRACVAGGVWLAAADSWAPWRPGVDPVPDVGVVVDVGRLVDDVRRRADATTPARAR